MTNKPTISRTVILLLLSAFLLYSIGVWWGMPYATAADRVKAWGVDDESPLGPLTEIHNIIHPKPNQWLSYPLLYSFITAAAYAPYMLYLLATGGLTQISATYPFGLTDPISTLRVLTVIAHLVSAGMGALAVGAAYEIGQTLSNRRTGLFYALLVLCSFPLIYYARTGNVDATALAFATLSIAAFCRVVCAGLSLRRGLWLGALVGLALGAKESAIGLFFPMPFILLYQQFGKARDDKSSLPTVAFWQVTGWSLLAGVLTFGFGSGLFIDPHRYLAHVAYLRSLLALVANSETAAAYTFPYTVDGHLGYLQATLQNLLATLRLPGLLLVLVGLVYAVKKRSLMALPGLLAIAYLLYLFLSYRLVQVRYLMPVIFLLLFYVAQMTVAAAQTKTLLPRLAGVLLGLLVFGSGLLTAVDVTYQMLFDSRYAAAAWLAAQTKAGDNVAYFGAASVLPSFKADVVTTLATEFRGMYVKPRLDDGKVQEILTTWQAEQPTYVLVMPDHTNRQPLPYPHTVPPQLYDGLLAGTLGYELVAHFQTPALFPWLPQPLLDYPAVNPPIRLFAPTASGEAAAQQ